MSLTAPWSCLVNLSSPLRSAPVGKRMGVRSSGASVSTENVDGFGVIVESGKRRVVEVSMSDGRPAPARSSEESGGQPEELDMLYEEGYGDVSVMDYFDVPDGDPPRWFCPVECGQVHCWCTCLALSSWGFN